VTIDELITKWWGSKGGAERSNLSPFITDLCLALDLPLPGQAESGKLGAYEYEGSVPGGSFRSVKGTGSIDLYKRGCFILEAKQSQLPAGQQASLFEPAENAPQAPSGARYDLLMRDARAQAENYAKNLPGDHPPVPFLIVLDIGRAFEIEFDYTGNGRGYGFFPDKQRYRIELPQLASTDQISGVRKTPADLLRAIWTDPESINPRLQSAEVTSGIARRLAQVSQYLEESNRNRARDAGSGLESQMIEETSLFLMRIIFCMFAEDIGLLPKDQFKAFLEGSIEDQNRFEQGLHDLWSKMNQRGGGYAWAVNDVVKYFNGGLFESDRTFVISNADRGELFQAAKADWRKVEPAIFGTLLEQALTKAERAKLGAHYTPRPYVERLVQATIMDVLEPEWAAIIRPSATGEAQDRTAMLEAAQVFHDRLAAIHVLDPACGTGNFLYVAMEALQQLEAKVIETIQTLGGEAQARIEPHQFYGLELNPRAAKIAELVLWIGWLRFRIINDPADIPDPVLASAANINFGRHGGYDAVLAQKDTGEPDLENPHLPAWPEADFIVGNPPFIGGKDIRARLGGDYAEALWKANARVAPSADFVMHWWDRAAHTLIAADTRLKRFGFVTTNSITQEFSRRVIQSYLNSPEEAGNQGGEGANRLSLIYAIPDHPWTKASRDSAAVRIAMTVAEVGESDGCFVEVMKEARLDSDTPQIELIEARSVIHANLAIGADVTSAIPLRASEGLCSAGVKLHGDGFLVSPSEAEMLGLGEQEGLENFIRPYVNGRDLQQRSRGLMVIDLFGLSEAEARQRFPEVYQYLLQTVWDYDVKDKSGKTTGRDGRKYNSRLSYKKNWWIFGEPRGDMRPALFGLRRFIVTVETAKHRIFQFIDSSILPDNKLILIACDDAFKLGVLSSSQHVNWSLQAGGWLGAGNDSVYVKSKVFDPFPFPDTALVHRQAVTDLAEELDATRKTALTELPGLTMTELYNLREKLRSGATLSKADQDRATAARAGIVNRLHEQLDAAVAAAYGWPADLPPSEIVTRLVTLNAERAAEEKAGKVRWLRPDYQKPRFGKETDQDAD
jgi:hypothetical protein